MIRRKPSRVDAFGNLKSEVPVISESELERRYGALEETPENTVDNYADPVSVMTGFSVDTGKEPADLLYQGLMAARTSENLEENGLEADLTYVVADDQSYVSEPKLDQRISVLESFVRQYDIDADVVLQSDLDYDGAVEEAKEEIESNEDFAEAVRTSVPPDKRLDEDAHPMKVSNNSDYQLKQAATVASIDPDLKVGPPDEKYFDTLVRNNTFRELAGIQDSEQLTSLIQSPTLPACKSFSHGTGEALPSDGPNSYENLKNNGGVPPYKDTHTRIELGDDAESIRSKLEAAPLEQEIDMSLVVEGLEARNPTGQSDLPNKLEAHLERMNSEDNSGSNDHGDDGMPPSSNSIYDYGGVFIGDR